MAGDQLLQTGELVHTLVKARRAPRVPRLAGSCKNPAASIYPPWTSRWDSLMYDLRPDKRLDRRQPRLRCAPRAKRGAARQRAAEAVAGGQPCDLARRIARAPRLDRYRGPDISPWSFNIARTTRRTACEPTDSYGAAGHRVASSSYPGVPRNWRAVGWER
jgi:hypothetical protein